MLEHVTEANTESPKKLKSNLFNSESKHSSNLRPSKQYVVYYDNLGETENITIEVPPNATVLDIIEETLEQVSCLPKGTLNYEVYMAKRNGKPKTEYPAYELCQ
jgi:hypothetical protein